MKTRTCLCAWLPLLLTVPALAQRCLPDADRDGHPIFGNPQVTPWLWPEQNSELTTVLASATDIVFDDFDGDGNLDVAAACNSGNPNPAKYIPTEYVSVMLGHGDGTFSPPSFYDAGKEPCGIASADLNGDAKPDLALANAHANQPGTVSVLLNKGDGTFWQDVEYSVGSEPRCVRAGDLTGDGKVDIAALNIATKDVSILVGKGDGTVGLEVRIAVGTVSSRGNGNLTFPYPGPFMALADLDGDEDLDLALPCGSKVRFLINDGKGMLSLSASVPAFSGGSVYDIAVADLSGDGVQDLAVALIANTTTPKAGVALGLGGLQFSPPTAYDVSTESPNNFHFVTGISAGDVDADGDLDLGVAHEWYTHAVLLRNKGDGTFAPMELIETAAGPWVVRWRDVNVDGESDFAVVTDAFTNTIGRIGVLLSEAGTPLSFEPNRGDKQEFPWINPFSVDCADLDADGMPDVAVASAAVQDPGAVIVVINDGSGVLGPGIGYALGGAGSSSPQHVVAGDLTGDGLADLVACTIGSPSHYQGPGQVHVLANIGGGAMDVREPVELPGYLPLAAAIGDMDGDLDNDVVAVAVEYSPGDVVTLKDRRVLVLANDGHGVLSIAKEIKIATMTWSPQSSVAVGDVDGDGDLDVVATSASEQTAGKLVVLTNDGSGQFSIDQEWDTPHLPWSVFVGDLDGDMDPDIALGNRVQSLPDPYLIIYKNDGRGKFQAGQSFSNKELRSRRMIGADFDGDGDTDIAFTNDYSSVMVHLNNGDGTFASKFYYGAGSDAGGLAAADIDGDGRTDLVVCNGGDHNICVLRNRLCSTACFADCDASGELDVDDFICFQTEFAVGDAKADCDDSGELDIDDFICFQTAFGIGCR